MNQKHSPPFHNSESSSSNILSSQVRQTTIKKFDFDDKRETQKRREGGENFIKIILCYEKSG